MAAGKEIRTKISSIQSTQKITSAMEMVAASKMRRAQDRMQLGKPYAQRMRAVVGHIANSTPEYRHAYMQEREVKRAGYIIVSTGRGLCGGLNINLFKASNGEEIHGYMWHSATLLGQAAAADLTVCKVEKPKDGKYCVLPN